MNNLRNTFFFLFLLTALGAFSQTDKRQYSFNVDNFPSIDGGKTEMKRFVHDHLVYPSSDFQAKKEGLVLLGFVVNKEGKTVNPTVLKSLSPAADKEALRLVELIEWIPSYKDGHPVDIKFDMEFAFSVSKYKKQVKERGFDKSLFTEFQVDSSNRVYDNASIVPLFNVADKGLEEFVYEKLEYPEVASRQNLEGKIPMSFIIEPNGMVSNIKLLNEGVSGGCNDEAIRVIGLTHWKPAVRDNRYVRYRMRFTMSFSLKNNFKDNSNGSQRSWGQ